MQLANAMVVLHKLSTFESPDWDLDYVRQTVDFGNILDNLIRRFNEIQMTQGAEQGKQEGRDIFFRISRKLGRIKAWHEEKTTLRSSRRETTSAVPDGAPVMNGDLEFFNEAWLEDILGPWDYQSNVGLT